MNYLAYEIFLLIGSRRLIHRMRVLLPDPPGPQMITTSPSSTWKVTLH